VRGAGHLNGGIVAKKLRDAGFPTPEKEKLRLLNEKVKVNFAGVFEEHVIPKGDLDAWYQGLSESAKAKLDSARLLSTADETDS
jgi:hypothetical protein